MNSVYYLLVLFGSLALLMYLVVRGKSIFVVAPLCALLAVTLSGEDPLAKMNGAYMAGFADYVKRFFLIFALGAVFGKLMEESGAAITVAHGVGKVLGKQRACLAVVLACALLTYGGVSLFVVGFSVYPLAVQLFRGANLPRRFIPAAIAFGSITFTMTSAGSPEIQNLIPIQYLVDAAGKPLTDARAGWPVSIFVATFMFVVGQWYLDRKIRVAVTGGEHFEARDGDHVASPTDLNRPTFKSAITPLVVTLLALNLLPWLCHSSAKCFVSQSSSPTWHAVLSRFPEDATLAIFLGVLAGIIVMRRQRIDVWKCFGDGFVNGLMAVGSTSAVVGFGSAVKDLRSFQMVVTWVTHIPGDPLIGAAIAVAVIAGIAGSASGGQAIALPILKPIYIDGFGVMPRALHRVVSIASGSLDSLPANGYLVMLIRNICGETHARSYGPIFVTTVLLPAAGTALAIALFKWFPSWGEM
ncbi:MAG: GntP family permease [Planctomycetaceae bacterium]